MTDPAFEPPHEPASAPVAPPPATPLDAAGEAAPAEPFERIRARTLVWWGLVWFVLVAIGAAFGSRVELLVYTLYPFLLIWVLYQLDHAGLHITQFVRMPAREDWRRLWLVIPSLLFSLAVVVLAVALLHLSPGALHDRETEAAIQQGPTSLGALAAVFAMIVAAPFTEELVFRGILLHRWARKWGFTRGAIASSAAFAVLHPDPLGAFVFALIMVYLYTRSRSLLVPMAAHALNNTFVVLAILSGARAGDAATPPAQEAAQLAQAIPAMIVVGLLALGTLGVYFSRVPSLAEWRLPMLTPRAAAGPTPAR